MISGTAKGHKLKTIRGITTRPTSDRVKESLFNIIAGYVAQAEVLDLYAGTGSLGIEALSRGAMNAVFVDRDRLAVSVIKDNLLHTRLMDRAEVINAAAAAALEGLSARGKSYDLIFLDPPYNKGLIPETITRICRLNILTPGGIIVSERSREDEVPEAVGCLKVLRNQRYGDTVLTFYSRELV